MLKTHRRRLDEETRKKIFMELVHNKLNMTQIADLYAVTTGHVSGIKDIVKKDFPHMVFVDGRTGNGHKDMGQIKQSTETYPDKKPVHKPKEKLKLTPLDHLPENICRRLVDLETELASLRLQLLSERTNFMRDIEVQRHVSIGLGIGIVLVGMGSFLR